MGNPIGRERSGKADHGIHVTKPYCGLQSYEATWMYLLGIANGGSTLYV